MLYMLTIGLGLGRQHIYVMWYAAWETFGNQARHNAQPGFVMCGGTAQPVAWSPRSAFGVAFLSPDEQLINPSELAARTQALSPDARNIRQDDPHAQGRGPHQTSHAPRQAHYRTAGQPRGAGCRKHA